MISFFARYALPCNDFSVQKPSVIFSFTFVSSCIMSTCILSCLAILSCWLTKKAHRFDQKRPITPSFCLCLKNNRKKRVIQITCKNRILLFVVAKTKLLCSFCFVFSFCCNLRSFATFAPCK